MPLLTGTIQNNIQSSQSTKLLSWLNRERLTWWMG